MSARNTGGILVKPLDPFAGEDFFAENWNVHLLHHHPLATVDDKPVMTFGLRVYHDGETSAVVQCQCGHIKHFRVGEEFRTGDHDLKESLLAASRMHLDAHVASQRVAGGDSQ